MKNVGVLISVITLISTERQTTFSFYVVINEILYAKEFPAITIFKKTSLDDINVYVNINTYQEYVLIDLFYMFIHKKLIDNLFAFHIPRYFLSQYPRNQIQL